MARDIEIYDTTLRDGTQGEGVAFSLADKLRIAERLDAFGVHYIEGGWPGSNPKDIDFFAQARHRTFRRARLAAFGSTRRKDVAVEHDDQVRLLIDAATPVVTIFGKTWLLHVLDVLQTTPEENLLMIEETVRFLKQSGRFVVYDAEHAFDGCKDDREYAFATWQAAERGGADVITLCDTNGGSLPRDIAEITRFAAGGLGTRIGIHTHDDIGLGVANALAALDAGASHVQGTLNGYGERTGNCNLTSVMPILAFKYRHRGVPAESLANLRELSQFVDETANIRPNPRLPWVGAAAFSHKGGTHVNAVQKVIRSYEHIDPALVGNEREILISELAGRGSVLARAEHAGIPLDDDAVRSSVEKLKEREHRGYSYEAADASFELLLRREAGTYEPLFRLESFRVVTEKRADGGVETEATIKLWIGDRRYIRTAEGNGPVNALDRALRGAITEQHPEIAEVELTNFKVRILDEHHGTASVTRVLLDSSDGVREWSALGVSENVIEASWEALVDSLEFAFQPRPEPAGAGPAELPG
jgi:2-isopropylmalate synthase